MKKIKITLITTTLLIVSLSCKAQQIQEPNLDSKIIGTWIHNEDNNVKLIFSSNGKLYHYYDNALTDTYDYWITTECNGRITTANYDIFLKLTDNEDLDTTCDLLSAIHTDSNGVTTLSITSERGKLHLYTKQ
ncbi:MAG: hypothetical protein GKR88_05215 [Flavobacteriaceae bacterium]|nr:MAG: hypothetical protein GKR88_05215 [Flavobacteriaceae bacterium]